MYREDAVGFQPVLAVDQVCDKALQICNSAWSAQVVVLFEPSGHRVTRKASGEHVQQVVWSDQSFGPMPAEEYRRLAAPQLRQLVVESKSQFMFTDRASVTQQCW